MFLTVLNGNPPYETIMDYSTTLKTNTLTQKDAVYFQMGGLKVVFIL